MATKNVQANAWKTLNRDGTWDNTWYPVGSDMWEVNFSYGKLLCERFPVDTMRITRVRLSTYVTTKNDATVNYSLIARLYRDDPKTGTPIATVTKGNYKTGSLDFDFSGFTLDVKGGNLYTAMELDTHGETVVGNEVGFTFPSVSIITYSDIPALTPTIVLPTGTQNGAQGITFTWQTNTGAGTQTKAELQWSKDGVNWQNLATVSTAQSYTAPAATFPAGAIYSRLRTTSSYGVISSWVQRNFTVQYAAASVTLTTPTSGSVDGGGQIIFAWSITAGGGSITGTQMGISTDDGLTWTTVLDSSASVDRYTAAAGSFPAGKLIWRVRARDSYAGWSTYKQANFTVAYNAVSQVVPVNTPTSGIYNAASSRTFIVALQASGTVHTPFTITAATMYWRSGESGDFTSVAMTPDGNQASVLIAAGTFPSGIFQWYAEATDNTNRTTSTEIYTLSALNASVEATPLSPINTLESGTGTITFIWSYGSLDGSPQSKAEIRFSINNGTDWTTLPVIYGSSTSTVVPAGTFPAGTITWQVRAYNEAENAGPWSASVSFISFSAPIISGIIGDGKPFLTISWQVDAQQAYELEINERTYGPYYGENVRSFTLPEPLPDGSYTVRVRAQNRYGLWSEWAEGNVSVTNVPGPRVIISATSGNSVDVSLEYSRVPPIITEQPQDLQTTDTNTPATFQCGLLPQQKLFRWQVEMRQNAQAEWTAFTEVKTLGVWGDDVTFTLDSNSLASYDGAEFRFHIWDYSADSLYVYSRAAKFTFASPTTRSRLITGFFPPDFGYFMIYRDGKLIAKTYSTKFVDSTVLGTHKYYALQVIENGYYTRSLPLNPVEGTASVECNMISLLDGGDFIPLDLSDDFDQNVAITRRTHTAKPFYSGAKYPAVEIGEQEELAASFSTFWIDDDDENASVLEAMKGKPVILKLVSGMVIIGVLDSLPGVNSAWRKAYTISVSQMEWEDFVDDT